jgi:NhaC family Na+:H+ antiporter
MSKEPLTQAPRSLRTPTVFQALSPITVLITLLSFSVYLFGGDASFGPNQIALCVGAVVASIIGWRNGQTWDEIENSITSGIMIAIKPVLILFSVGVLIGAWIMSGTVPTMIYYSLLILDPSIFYAASCLICGIIALSIGSSWTVAGTVGIALIGAAAGMGLSIEITNFRCLFWRQNVSTIRNNKFGTSGCRHRSF